MPKQTGQFQKPSDRAQSMQVISIDKGQSMEVTIYTLFLKSGTTHPNRTVSLCSQVAVLPFSSSTPEYQLSLKQDNHSPHLCLKFKTISGW